MTYPPIPAAAKLPTPAGTPVIGEIPQVSQVSPLELEWAGSSGSGTVTSVTAADPSIVVTGTDTVDPEIATAPLDVIATQHPPAANWSNNSKKITNVANGSGAQDVAAFGQIAAAVPLTTEGDLLYENATPAPARLAIGTAGESLQVVSGLPAWGAAMTLLATTGVGGYVLVNGTGNIITWTPPNDGNLHRVLILATLGVSVSETGGTIGVNVTLPNGISGSTPTLIGANQSTGIIPATMALFVEANNSVTLRQFTAQTVGTATLWAEIWGF